MALSLDGLASNLPTTELIRATMAVEAIPQNMLKSKVAQSETLNTALQGLNKQLAALNELATTTIKPEAFQVYKATASDESVTVTAGATANAGTLDFTVGSTAQKHTAATAALTAWPSTDLVIEGKNGPVTITAASTSLDDVVKAVNASATAGVNATKVSAGTNAAGEPTYRLQFTAKESGSTSGFTVKSGATDMFAQAGAAVIRQGSDASITLFKGTAAEQTITSATNTFQNVLAGTSITVSKTTTEPVTVNVARDENAVVDSAKKLVEAITGVFGTIRAKSLVTKTTTPEGTKTTLGPFTSDSMIRTINQQVMTAATAPVDGRSPSEIGISITKDGSINFDAEKLKKALAAEPAHVEKVLNEISTRVAKAADVASDKHDGLLTQKIKGQETTIRGLNDQISNWDRRLESREKALRATYTALEVSMSRMNSQSNYLASQMLSMPSNGNN